MWVPIMKREFMNRMYGPANYYMGRVLSALLFYSIYPLIISSILFFCLGLNISFQNFILFVLTAVCMVNVSCCIGFLFGVMFYNNETARIVVNLLMNYFFCIAGGFVNISGLDVINRYLNYISPCRFTVEIFVRIFSSNGNWPDTDTLKRDEFL